MGRSYSSVAPLAMFDATSDEISPWRANPTEDELPSLFPNPSINSSVRRDFLEANE